MRAAMWVFVAVTGSCAVETAGPTGPSSADDESGGGLPTPHCGTACETTGACVGCGYSSHLCFGDVGWFTLGNGSCTADGTTGTDRAQLPLAIDGTSINADRAGASISGAYVELVAHAGQHRISVLVPSAPGTYDCAVTSPVVVQYTSPTGERSANRPVAGRLPCSITITAVGAVGERVEGALSAQVPTTTGTVTLDAATFSVVRVPSP